MSGDTENYRVYIKGAPEVIVPRCAATFSTEKSMEAVQFQEEQMKYVRDDIVSEQMAEIGLKPITYAFKEIKKEEYHFQLQQYGPESYEFRSFLEENLCYLANFGLYDPIPEDITRDIDLIMWGHNYPSEDEKATV